MRWSSLGDRREVKRQDSFPNDPAMLSNSFQIIERPREYSSLPSEINNLRLLGGFVRVN